MSDSVILWTVARQALLSMGILLARIQECVAMSSRGSSRPRDRTQVSHIAGRFFTTEPSRKPKLKDNIESESEVAQSCPTLRSRGL